MSLVTLHRKICDRNIFYSEHTQESETIFLMNNWPVETHHLWKNITQQGPIIIKLFLTNIIDADDNSNWKSRLGTFLHGT